ncbi:hypothetical protein [Streptomyces fulvorobeus]|uniref:Uncharacterized protein n=1 Tax=Streptomyces fulvorobeus TaxID=284028 RepID=A0A7J0C3F3_9ACTN|nr:hypothetical protein [Streptomyces fulvorobeus]NYE40710.1 hypothetical protein [Streptomyces fulvorobeus]GFM97012.1 hypothetical protein Sfulv_18230 [Streptomyces fulvorobeus]
MTDRPITPTRIIPAGAPLPDRGPLPGEIPPWRAAPVSPPPPPPPAVPPPPPDPAPLPVPQIHVHVLMPYEAPPEPTRWEHIRAWLLRTIGRPWQICGALALAVMPIPGTEYSAATGWAHIVSLARAEAGQDAGYALALTPLAIAVIRITTGGGTLRRLLLLAVSLVGFVGGAIDLYDPVTWITGVTR